MAAIATRKDFTMKKRGMLIGVLTGTLLLTGCSCVDSLNAARDGVGNAISGLIDGIQAQGRDTTSPYRKWQEANEDVVNDIEQKTSQDYEKRVEQVEREQNIFYDENGKNWYGISGENGWYGKPQN